MFKWKAEGDTQLIFFLIVWESDVGHWKHDERLYSWSSHHQAKTEEPLWMKGETSSISKKKPSCIWLNTWTHAGQNIRHFLVYFLTCTFPLNHLLYCIAAFKWDKFQSGFDWEALSLSSTVPYVNRSYLRVSSLQFWWLMPLDNIFTPQSHKSLLVRSRCLSLEFADFNTDARTLQAQYLSSQKASLWWKWWKFLLFFLVTQHENTTYRSSPYSSALLAKCKNWQQRKVTLPEKTAEMQLSLQHKIYQ